MSGRIKIEFECAECGHKASEVVDTRFVRKYEAVSRRRKCLKCGFRFTTYELQKTNQYLLFGMRSHEFIESLIKIEAQLEMNLERVKNMRKEFMKEKEN